MRCPSCNRENPADASFCEECGAKLELICPACEASVGAGARFCKKCGTAIGPARAFASTTVSSPKSPIIVAADGQASAAAEGERKTVTALFADIKGSTELMEDLDPEEARAIIDPALKQMIDAVRRYDGYVVQSTGDGIFALFGAPVAHEDHPQRALYAALRMQEDLGRHSDRVRAEGGLPIQARIGVNTGEVVVRSITTGEGQTEYTPIGHTTNLASRMQTLAPIGSIAATDAARKLCEGYFIFRGLGPTKVKGLTEPVNVYEVTGLGPLRTRLQRSAGRGLTKFVGRERETEALEHALAQAGSGHGQIVAVMAEAGAGKSRLFYEFKAILPTGCKLLEAYSVSHGKASAWLPVLELLRGYFAIADADGAAVRREKVRSVLATLDHSLNDTLPYLFGLLGIQDAPDPLAEMAPPVKRQRTLEAIKRLVLSESQAQPTVVIFEDLHWIDGETQALLDLLADSIAAARVLLLVNYRPEYRHEWAAKSYYSQLQLEALAGENADAMLAALLGDAVELAPLKRMIVERTEGNPFFIEEMVQALFDQGALVRNGTVKVMRSFSQLRLPPTVQGILAARIDRLPSEHKEVLQILAVIGRESRLGLVKRIAAHVEAHLERILRDLRTSEFVHEGPASADIEYVFKHALTQEVAYNSLLIERRKLLHERAGQAIEAMFADNLDDHVTELAHHYSHTDNVAKAVEYLGRAGQQAIQRSAHADAVANLTVALDLLRRLPDSPGRAQRELPLQLALGQASIVTRGWAASEVEQAFSRALEICDGIGDPPESFFVLYGLWSMYHVRGNYGAARERANELLRRARRTNNPTQLVLAHIATGQTSLHTGELLLATEHLKSTVSLYERERDQTLITVIGTDPKQSALSYTGWNLWLLGYPDQAVESSKQATIAARERSHLNSMAGAEFFNNIILTYRRELRAVRAGAEHVIALSLEHGLGAWLLFSSEHLGWAKAQQGQYEEGIEQMRQGLAMSRAAGANIGRTDLLSKLAELLMMANRLDDALDTIAEALNAVEVQKERYSEAEIYRLKGEVLLRQSPSNGAEAQACFYRAIEIARHSGAKSWELRATISLARLLMSQGRRDEARTMLAEIYGWFTEGLDTADLRDAKQLLDELNE